MKDLLNFLEYTGARAITIIIVTLLFGLGDLAYLCVYKDISDTFFGNNIFGGTRVKLSKD